MTPACLVLVFGAFAWPQADVRTASLRIDDKHITHEWLHDGLAVGVGGPDAGLAVTIGVVITANRIDARLRTVDGTVRYRLRPEKVLVPIRALVK